MPLACHEKALPMRLPAGRRKKPLAEGIHACAGLGRNLDHRTAWLVAYMAAWRASQVDFVDHVGNRQIRRQARQMPRVLGINPIEALAYEQCRSRIPDGLPRAFNTNALDFVAGVAQARRVDEMDGNALEAHGR